MQKRRQTGWAEPTTQRNKRYKRASINTENREHNGAPIELNRRHNVLLARFRFPIQPQTAEGAIVPLDAVVVPHAANNLEQPRFDDDIHLPENPVEGFHGGRGRGVCWV